MRAICLLSGGLDSQLAVCVLREQGVDVVGLAFESPFFGSRAARAAAGHFGIPLNVLDFTADIVELLNRPKHGFGSCMNPCIDCHARMLHRAGGMLQEWGCQFLSTGEVLNERPMSQTRRSLGIVARESGYADRVLRPLSALRLPETRVEQAGWVDRRRLLSLEGRSRKPQIALAAQFGIKQYPTPSGGCLLTEPIFCRRLRDLKEHEGIREARPLQMLRIGRHFRLSPGVKLIVGRHQEDNNALDAAAENDILLRPAPAVPGPSALLSPQATEEELLLAAAICVKYSDAPAGRPATVLATSPSGTRRIEAMGASPADIERLRL